MANYVTGFVSVASVDTSNIKLHTDRSVASLYGNVQRQRAALTKGEFDALTTMQGYNHMSVNLFRDNDIDARVVSGIMFDWMHVFMVNG